MSVDHELRQAVEQSEIEARAALAEVRPQGSPSGRLRLWVSCGLALAGVGACSYLVSLPQLEPRRTVKVAELLAQREKHLGRKVLVRGDVAPGTLNVDGEGCRTRFVLSDGEARVPVHYSLCLLPDTLRDRPGYDVPVTADGVLAADGHLEATALMAKGGGRYEMGVRAWSSASPLQVLEAR